MARAKWQKEREEGLKPLTLDDFEFIRNSSDLEAVCSFVYDKVHWKWSFVGYDSLSIGERTVLAVETFFGETCNGGINQYLVNEGGAFAQELPEALARCGLMNYARIALDLRGLFSGEIPRDPTERWERVSGIESRVLQRVSRSRPRDRKAGFNEVPDALLEELTDRFFDLYFPVETEELYLGLAAYIRGNPSEFVPAPDGG